MKPLITGSEMKLARKPRRSSAGEHGAAIPVVMRERGRRRGERRVARARPPSATVAADSAAVADIGPTTRCRELPSAA